MDLYLDLWRFINVLIIIIDGGGKDVYNVGEENSL